MKRIMIVLLLTLGCQVQAQDTVTLPGLRDTVQVLTPQTAIPSIVARNELDAAYVQGYLQAQDRFWQMDFSRRQASGTISELVGVAALGDDIQLRTLGFRRAAWRTYSAMSPEARALLQAYANGVNAWLGSNPLPPEYGALELSVAEPWSPVDSIAFAKLLAFSLSSDLGELDLTTNIGTYQGFGQALGFDGTALFFEDTHRPAPPDDRVTAPGFLASIGGIGQKDAGPSLAEQFPQISRERVELSQQVLGKLRETRLLGTLLKSDASDIGSNFWILAGSETDSGAPIIANDPHLGLNVPAVWWPVHVNVTDDSGEILNVAGVSFPGAPVVAQGCNSTLCWGSTVNPIDELDFYFETLRTNTLGLPTHTIYQGKEEPVIWIFQSYFANQLDGVFDNPVRQNVGADAGGVTFIVPRRNNGPILGFSGGRAISAQYTGWGATFELEAFLGMAKSRTVMDFREASLQFDFGSQNFGVADIFGNIGYFTPAELPIREDLQVLGFPDGGIPPLFIREGDGSLRHEWLPVRNPQPSQALPFEIMSVGETPQLMNPASGYIANANNDPVGTSLDNNPLNQLRPNGGIYYLSQGGYSSYRQGRIDRLIQDRLASGVKVDVATMKAWQANNQMLDAEILMPHILGAFSNAAADGAWVNLTGLAADPQLQEVLALFSAWDFSTPTGIPEGYDPGDNPFALSAPGQAEIDASVAATVYSAWRGQVIRNTIDATLQAIGLGDNLPSSTLAFNSLEYMLEVFDTRQGVGASGINFFTNPDAPNAEAARDFVLLASLRQALDLLASDEFAPAFGNSTNVMDYRWGKLHRIELDHPLNDVFTLPNGLYGFSTVEGLRGIPRSGGYQVLDASGHSARADGLNEFMFGSGPSRRFVGQMLPGGIIAEQVFAGGQSGVLGDVNYANQLYPWLVNAYVPLLLDPDVVGQIAVDQVTFQPIQ